MKGSFVINVVKTLAMM
uniref:Uncharacterized protein n=1 Tax=Acrobeloides nanus TaxID=290746 RepID=A0A914DN52_9BILA